jgi:parallel beta-helix repeat protein
MTTRWKLSAILACAPCLVVWAAQAGPSARADDAPVRGPLLQTTPVTGAVITGTPSVTLYVSNQATNGYEVGNDANDGTSPASPLATINEAARRANRNQAGVGTPAGPVGTLIMINDGTYHEYIDWRGYRRVFDTASYSMVSYPTVGAQVPVIFQAEHTGAVRIDGADTTRTTGATTVSYATDATGVDAWEPTEIGGAIVYSHRWVDELGQPIDLGFFPNPFGPSVDYGIVARRRETAFIDDRLLRQVMCKSDLAPGTFYVSDASMGTGYVYPYPLVDTAGQVIDTVPRRTCTEAAPDHRIYVVPFGDEPGGWEHATFATTFRGARVRTDPRSSPPGLPLEEDGSSFLFHAENKSNVVLRGLTFVHASSRMRGSSAAVRLQNSRDILLEDTRFEFNNWIGVSVFGTRNPTPGAAFDVRASGVTLRHVTSNSNGGHGVTATWMKNLVIEDTDVEFNNWRGDWAGLYNWDPGNKLMWVHDLVVRRSNFSNNLSHGLWLDTNHVNSTVEDSTFTGNRGHGLYIEASIGPLTVQRNTFRDNGRFESYPGIEGYGIFATFTNNMKLDQNVFVGNDIPLVIAGRTEHTHEPMANSYDFETGLGFANTANDPRGANWQITGNSFTVSTTGYLISLGIPLENFWKYVPWAADNDWSRFLSTLTASDNVYSSLRPGGGAFAVQNTRTCVARYLNGDCSTWTTNPVFTDRTFPEWQALTGQDLAGSRWDGPPLPPPPTTTTVPDTTTTTTIPPPPPTPLIDNGSFETPGATPTAAAGWTNSTRYTRVTGPTERTATGDWSMRLTGSSGPAVATSTPITVIPGHRYLLTGRVYRTSTAGRQYIDLNDVTGDPNAGWNSTTVGTWDQVQGTWTAPPGTTTIRIRLVSDGATNANPSTTTWFDDITFTEL